MRSAIKWMKERDNFVILYDGDCDGICSGALVKLLLEGMGKNVVKMAASPRPSLDKNPAMELLSGYDNLIILDISMDEINVKAVSGKNVLNIDHHHTGLQKSKGKIIVFKRVEPYSPTSLLTYELGKAMLKDFDKHDWISATGTIADYGGPSNEEFIKRVHEKYGLFIGEQPFFDSQIGTIANVVNSARMAGETNKLNLVVKTLTTCPGPKEFLKAEMPSVKYLFRTYEKVSKTLQEELDRFKNQATRKNGRTLFLLKNPKYNIRSTLVTILSTRSTETIAVAELRNTPYVHVSLRSKTENVIEIIEELKKLIECRGGGHKAAAGLTMNKDDFPVFKGLFLKTTT